MGIVDRGPVVIGPESGVYMITFPSSAGGCPYQAGTPIAPLLARFLTMDGWSDAQYVAAANMTILLGSSSYIVVISRASTRHSDISKRCGRPRTRLRTLRWMPPALEPCWQRPRPA